MIRDVDPFDKVERVVIDRAELRPRLSELAAMRAIKETGERRSNDSGKFASVWKAA